LLPPPIEDAVLAQKIASIEPTMIRAADGSWLAVAGPGKPIRCGVFGPSREAAEARFHEAITAAAERFGDSA
jgi:hypothetical protein